MDALDAPSPSLLPADGARGANLAARRRGLLPFFQAFRWHFVYQSQNWRGEIVPDFLGNGQVEMSRAAAAVVLVPSAVILETSAISGPV